MSKTRDYLEVDDPVNGQSYVCLSFISPNDVIKDKEAFKVAKFLQSVAKESDKKFEDFYDEYQNFQYKYQDDIQKDFDKEVGSLTNIRGVKVRGVYSTKDEAEHRAKKLHLKDKNFHVFVGQVGYWLPWNPCADKISDEKFIDQGLNDLMKKYKENRDGRDELYEEEKRKKIEAAEEEVRVHKEKMNNEEKKKEEIKQWKIDQEDNIQKTLNNLVGEVTELDNENDPEPEQEPEQEPLDQIMMMMMIIKIII
jgi:uncharacterized protein YeaO (DUF488 family)